MLIFGVLFCVVVRPAARTGFFVLPRLAHKQTYLHALLKLTAQIRLLEEDAAARHELILATREKSDDEKATAQKQIAALEFQIFTLDARCTEVRWQR